MHTEKGPGYNYFNMMYKYKDGKLYHRYRNLSKPVGSNCKGYLVIGALGRTHYVHRVIWLLCNKAWPTGELDHRDTIKSNNLISNLRLVTHTVNMSNTTRNNKVPGVSFSKAAKAWFGQIQVAGVKHTSSIQPSWFEAVCARKSMENKYLGATL